MHSAHSSSTRIVLESAIPALAYDLATDLEQRGLGSVEVRTGVGGPVAIAHGPGTSPSLVTKLLEALRPLAPESVGSDDTLAPGELIVRLGEPVPVIVDLRADSTPLLQRAATLVEQLGMRVGERHLEVQDHNKLHHTSAPSLSRQMLRWTLARRGLAVEEQEHANPSAPPEVRERLELRLRDPELVGKPFGERFAVQIATDDLAAGEELASKLRSEGFSSCQVVLRDEEDEEPRFRLHPGPFTPQRAPNELAKLKQTVEQMLTGRGLDVTRFPVVAARADQGLTARIDLPIARFRRPDARPYAGAFPDRFDVTLHTDDVPAVAPLCAALKKVGFTQIEVKEVPSLLDGPLADQPGGLVIRWSAAAREKSVASAFRACVEESMKQLGGLLPIEAAEQPGNAVSINVYFPVKGLGDGRLASFLADPRRYHLKLIGGEGGEWADLKALFDGMGFTVQEASEGGLRPRGRLEYGAAPPALIERVQESIRSLTGAPFPARRIAGGDEMQINVTLPRRVRKPAATANTPDPVIDLAAWLGEAESPGKPFLESSTSEVRIGNVRLPKRGSSGPLVPTPASFTHFCLDEVTASTLEHIAASVLLREPCLLEGETSTSKTTGILFLASRLGQPVVRINLNGQTDTGELIGRFVPSDERIEEEEEELASYHLAQSPSQSLPSTSLWRWQDGLVVQAMRKGWWVLLDEVNLAEPQILERLNSVLEVEPTLVLTEYDNSAVEGVHANFRMFATMNPAEYAGRSVLSPAYRDRWRGYRYVPRPGEGEYLAMLRLLVHGEQPTVAVQGRRFLASKGPAPFASLAGILKDEILIGLSRFQSSLEHAAGRAGETPRLGTRRKERHVFTRRGLLSVLEYLASPLGPATAGGGPRAVRQALARYYLGRVSDPHDQALVLQLLDAAGLGPKPAKK